MSETAKERFMRNNGECVRIMRAQAIKAEREGRMDDAKVIRKIADGWDKIGGIAEQSGDSE